MKILFSVITFFICFICSGQNNGRKIVDSLNNNISFPSCNLNPFVLDDGTFGIIYISNQSLEKYFKSKLPISDIKKMKGEILIQILIDRAGKACCKTISSPTGISVLQLDPLRLENIIQNMSRWKPATMDGKKWNASTLVSIILDGMGGLIVTTKTLKF